MLVSQTIFYYFTCILTPFYLGDTDNATHENAAQNVGVENAILENSRKEIYARGSHIADCTARSV